MPSLAQRFRRFAETEAARTSPLYERVATALSESTAALRAIETAPARRRNPALILAALHDLVLAGRAPALAGAYATGNAEAAAAAAVDTLVTMTTDVVAIAEHRQPPTGQTGRHAVLYPAIAEAAHRAGATTIAMIDVGRAAGLNLTVDRVGITYDNGQSLGDLSSTVRLSASVVGDRPIPTRAIPTVVARTNVGVNPIDITNPDEARWLRACRPPDDQGQLDAELTLAATTPRRLLAGDAVELLPEALAHVPADALPVITTTWALSTFSLDARLRFLDGLDAAATHRPVAWVSAEGVGVAPAIPTMGDRPASGHSIIGLALFTHYTLRAEALGRTWSQGRMLTWLAGA